MNDLPVREFAESHGYFLHSSNTRRTVVTYVKGDTYFTVNTTDMEATLERILGLVVCKISFSLPNIHFDRFEKQILSIRQDLP